MESKREFAVVGGGCFWCIEAIFEQVKGVQAVVSGYAGGHKANPTYEDVCTGETGHAEVVRIEYDPSQISYETLLKLFFHVHNPTTLNRQGNDVGTQYRSVILFANEVQRTTAQRIFKEIEKDKLWDGALVTEIVPLKEFFPAEEYHQHYFARNPNQGYCQIVIAPKIAKFRKQYPGLLQK